MVALLVIFSYPNPMHSTYFTIPILLIFASVCNAQSLKSIQGTMTCGDTVNGMTKLHNDTHNYMLNIYSNLTYIFINSAKESTTYSTTIDLYDQNNTKLNGNKYFVDFSGYNQAQFIFGPLSNDSYYITISSGMRDQFGSYTMEVSCFRQTCMIFLSLSVSAFMFRYCL